MQWSTKQVCPIFVLSSSLIGTFFLLDSEPQHSCTHLSQMHSYFLYRFHLAGYVHNPGTYSSSSNFTARCVQFTGQCMCKFSIIRVATFGSGFSWTSVHVICQIKNHSHKSDLYPNVHARVDATDFRGMGFLTWVQTVVKLIMRKYLLECNYSWIRAINLNKGYKHNP